MERKNLCAHRGVNALYPENTLPAFKAALGHAEEIELDLWPSLDGEIFVCHDRTVDRTTKGKGKIAELTAQELSRLGLPLFADVLALVQGRATINIHQVGHQSGCLQPKNANAAQGIRLALRPAACAA